ncbi:LacI family DNA-binding transcriptional regulator [Ornithinibacillus halotolerans]|uniref:LacI family transcriptional regulator n=1 Tax=Ornithinibacillus halotolerans TaxID=1274357 RepID=A0A916S9N7_9BACI|nr:substrate-binding domain-containing protein [Ornithinibacillus halotolerans]GGA90895.1 LacI family transcriptional regulator [Ornithinibacillus halotolerans]
MKTVTITDVAKHAGVSKSTVSQYLNKRYDYMAEKTKKKIEQAIEELGYQPNFLARSLKQKSTTTIGVITANILHVFSTQVIRAIEDFCNQHDFHVIVCNADDDAEKEKKYMDMLRAKQVDGIIIFPTGDNVETYNQMLKENYPIVFVDRYVPGLEVSAILLDNMKASTMAVNEFTRNGYEKIGLILPENPELITPRRERILGYKEAMKANGLTINPEYIQSTEVKNMQQALDTLLALPDPPNAIIAGNDLALYEVLKYTKEKEIHIPKDLGIVAIDDVPFANLYYPAITSIAQPAFEMGTKAAYLLFEKINKQNTSSEEVFRFEPELIVRSSLIESTRNEGKGVVTSEGNN